MRLADGALYWAKAHGRDVAFRYSPEVVEALSAEERAERLERSLALNAVRVLARAVDAKDAFTQRHSERVAGLAEVLADAHGLVGGAASPACGTRRSSTTWARSGSPTPSC